MILLNLNNPLSTRILTQNVIPQYHSTVHILDTLCQVLFVSHVSFSCLCCSVIPHYWTLSLADCSCLCPCQKNGGMAGGSSLLLSLSSSSPLFFLNKFCLFEKQGDKKISCICWLTPQIPKKLGLGQVDASSQELQTDPLRAW